LNNTAGVPGKVLTPPDELRGEREQVSGSEGGRIKRRAVTCFLTFSVSQLLFIAATVHGGESAPAKFLGSQSCAASMCHGGADEKHNQFTLWSKKDFHTRAPATLSMNRSARIAETLKITDAASDVRCTVCHNPFQTVPAGRKDPRVGRSEGVSCESCHNAAENWLLTHTRTDLTHEQKVAAGLRDLKNLYVRANTCVACHQNLEPEVRAAGHPELTFELDGQCVSMPRHWRETNRWRGAQAWQVGQAVALREGAVQSAAAKVGSDVAQRASALAWLLGVPLAEKAADDLARATTGENWSAAEVRSRLHKLAETREEFANASGSSGELAQRAERLVLGLDRLLVALGTNKNAGASAKLDLLFQDIQSRPDFAPTQFAEHLKEFESELAK
jgi:hypothetical protein